jgi:hypothetical protein
MNTPRYNLDDVPYCQIGMGAEAARLNGYKHGYQNVNTRGVCILTIGTDEYDAWQAGYTEGEADQLVNALLYALETIVARIGGTNINTPIKDMQDTWNIARNAIANARRHR